MYSNKIMEIFNNPKNIGQIKGADAIGECQNQENLEIVKFSASIENEIIKNVKVKVFGNAILIALSSKATEILKDKSLNELLELHENDILNNIDEIPVTKIYCVDLVLHAVYDLVEDYRKKQEKLAKKLEQEKNKKN